MRFLKMLNGPLRRRFASSIILLGRRLSDDACYDQMAAGIRTSFTQFLTFFLEIFSLLFHSLIWAVEIIFAVIWWLFRWCIAFFCHRVFLPLLQRLEVVIFLMAQRDRRFGNFWVSECWTSFAFRSYTFLTHFATYWFLLEPISYFIIIGIFMSAFLRYIPFIAWFLEMIFISTIIVPESCFIWWMSIICDFMILGVNIYWINWIDFTTWTCIFASNLTFYWRTVSEKFAMLMILKV